MATGSLKLIQKKYDAKSPEEAFDYAFQGIISNEGNYIVDNERYGISIETARSFGHKGSLSQFTVGMAKDVYKKGFWDANKLSKIYLVCPQIAMEMFEVAINLGVMRPALWLQRLCNSINTIKGGKYKYGDDLVLDGIINDTTISRLSSLNTKAHKIIYNGINSMHMSHYITHAYIKPTMRQFFVGWSLNRTEYNSNAEAPIHS